LGYNLAQVYWKDCEVSDQPIPGYYLMQLTKKGVMCGVRIWWGQPIDYETGNIQDRHMRWNAEINGDAADIDRVWPWCGTKPTTQAEYEYRCGLTRWSVEHAPMSPHANPRRKIDIFSSPMEF
jgi:hypothetical protein